MWIDPVGLVMDFNPRSREGSDRSVIAKPAEQAHFNPRSREGSDTFRRHRPFPAHISIHAPVKGATRIIILELADSLNFNPRSREGSDRMLYLQMQF